MRLTPSHEISTRPVRRDGAQDTLLIKVPSDQTVALFWAYNQ